MSGMIITYLGHSSFKIEAQTNGGKTVVVTDPFDPQAVGLPWPKPAADIVTVSHDHGDHNFVAGISGAVSRPEPFLVSGPGEYEVSGAHIYGVGSYHDEKEGGERGQNTIYLITAEGLNVVHLGDLGHQLTTGQVEELNTVDVLLIPVGGIYTIDPETATEVISQLEPYLVIPMHFKTDQHTPAFEKCHPLTDFLKAMGEEDAERLKKLTLKSRSDLPEETKVVVLEHS